MSKLNKKCFLASASMHLLLFLVLLVGPAFLMSHDKVEDMPVLDFIPAKLIDEQFYRISSPPSQPRQTPPSQPVPPQVKKTPEPPSKPAPKPEPKYTKAEDIKVTLKRSQSSKPKPKPTPPRPNFSGAAQAILKATASPNISISSSGPSYANYAQAVKSIYESNWFPPDETSRDDALVKVEVVIARSGAVLSSRIIGRSGDPSVDASVEATLRRVTQIRPFPEGAKESKRTFVIGFNLKARRAM